jgi:uncharacterized membrane protein YfcA
MELRLIYTVLVGIIAGILGGTFGLGGSFIMIPGILLLKIVPDYKMAIGTGLFTVLLPITLLAVIEYGKLKKIDYQISFILFVSYIIAAYFGSMINKLINVKILKYGSATTFLFVSFYYYYLAYTSGPEV